MVYSIRTQHSNDSYQHNLPPIQMLLSFLICLLVCALSSGYKSTYSTRLVSTIKNKAIHLNSNENEEDRLFRESKSVNDAGFTRKQLLRAETEAPFAKVRQFVYVGLIISAGLGFLTTLPALIAVSSGVRSGDLKELSLNLGINAGGILAIGLLIQRDLAADKGRLERIQKGGSLAALNVKITSSDGPLVVKLADLRRDRGIEKRVVIVAAPKELLQTSIRSSILMSSSLFSNDLLVIPLVLDGINSNGEISFVSDSISTMVNEELKQNGLTDESCSHLGYPVSLATWTQCLQKEFSVALSQNPQALDKGVTIVIKKNGKVGSRRFGVPVFEVLIDDIQMRKDAGLDTTNI